MSWYAQSESTEDTLLVAISNLLKRFGQHTNAANIKQSLADQGINEADYSTLPLIYPDLAVNQVGEANTWPKDHNAIVTFRYTDSEGVERMNHSLVTDAKLGRIADSTDGQEKTADMYGRPVSWATYNYAQDTATEDVPESTNAPLASAGSLYTLLEGETIWRVARRFGVNAEELATHNDIEPTVEEMVKVQEGHTLHLPIAREIHKQPEPIYQFYDEPKLMHVFTDKGASKWSFGNATTWEAIQKSGPTYRKGKTFTIVGVAQVQIAGEKEPAGYYIDTVSAGSNYQKSGRPKYTTGFNWRDLKSGEAVYPPSEVPVQDPPKPEPEEETPDIIINPNAYKATYQSFQDGAVEFRIKPGASPTDSVRVYDYDRLKAVSWPIYKHFKIAGTFKREGKLYGRPAECVAAGTWYGFPWNIIEEVQIETPEDLELYSTTANMSMKRLVFKDGRFNLEERIVTIPLSKLGRQRKTVVDLAYKIKQTLKDE